MSSIPGPLIRFVIDQPGLSAAVAPAMRQVRQQARSTSQAIADDWKRMAAQMRASIAQGLMSEKDMVSSRRALVSTLEREIVLLRTRGELSTKQLSSLKAMTLELERQKNALKTGAEIGITKGTEHALNQVGLQKMLGVTRTLDALVNRFAGGAAGSAFRTLRDTAYYSSLAGQESGKTGLLGKLFTPAGLATAGGVGALVAAGAGVLKLSVDGGKLAVEMSNLAAKTGLTTDAVIKLRSATSVLDVDFDRVVTGFRKFSQQITLANSASLPGATEQAKRAAKIFKDLGVNIQQAARDPFSAIQQLSRVLSQLPNGATKTALAVQLFGRGGMELLPVLNRMTPALDATKKSSNDLSKALTGGAAKSMEDLKAQMVNFKNETDALEVSLAQKVLPGLVTFVGWINSLASTFEKYKPFLEAIYSPSTLISQALKSRPTAPAINRGGFIDFMQSAAESAALQKKITADLGTTSKAVESLRDKVLASGAQSFYRGGLTPRSRRGVRSSRGRIYSGLGPAPGAGDLLFGLPSSPDFGILNLGMSGTGVQESLSKVNDEYFQATASESDKIKRLYDDQLNYWKNVQLQYPDYAQQAADAIEKIQTLENKKLADLQKKQFEKYKHQADALFGDMVSGNSKRFSKQFESDVENIVLEPFRKNFETLIGGLLQNLNSSINGGPSSGANVPGAISFGGIFGRLFGGVFGPGGTPGTFRGPLGIGGGSKASVAMQAGQTGIVTPTVNINAGRVNVGGSSGLGPIGGNGFLGGSVGSFGNFFGNLNPFGANSFSGNLGLGFPGATSSSGFGGLFGGGAGQIIGGLLVGGLGASHGSVTSEALGASGVATGLVKALASSGKISTGLASSLGKGFGGAGLLASGIAQGGLGGALSDIAGGAQIGTMIMPGIGTAIGAIGGAIIGGLRAIFGGHGWDYKVRRAMSRQAIYRPPSETFSFASNGSIAQTLQTGFGMSGNQGVAYSLPANTPFTASPIYGPLNNWQKQQLNQWMYGLNPNEPFYGAGASPYNTGNPFVGNFSGWHGRAFPTNSPIVQVHLNLPGYIDANSAATALAPHAEVIARLVSSKLAQASSGFGSAARRAAYLP